jgi:hypothetical protein
VKDLQSKNLQPAPALLDKIEQLQEILSRHSGVILVGDSQSGKTTCCILFSSEVDTRYLVLSFPLIK